MPYTRRAWLNLAVASSVGVFRSSGQTAPVDPWPSSALLEPSALAKLLQTKSNRPVVICVAFPVLYRQRHIPDSKFAGPTSKTEGLSALKEAVNAVPKAPEIVVYCGCCPMVKCPNIRPAYSCLKDLGYTNVRVLSLATNFHTDWVEKGFPAEPRVA